MGDSRTLVGCAMSTSDLKALRTDIEAIKEELVELPIRIEDRLEEIRKAIEGVFVEIHSASIVQNIVQKDDI